MASLSVQRANSFKPPSADAFRHKYDVFLSFSGEDTRGNFLEYLYRALCQKGILTFKDDNNLKDGEDIKSALLKAIEGSMFSIVVLSINYASSSWCLDELVQIFRCQRTTGHTVYPVFYHVEPSQVRRKEGEFGKGFAKAASGNKEKIEKWTEVLSQLANIKGWAYPSTRFENEAKLIDNLVLKIFEKSSYAYPVLSGDLVGIRSRMVEVIKSLDLGSDETRVVGLWGMGGIGKTTLAKAVYEAISWQFEGSSFIENVGELLKRSGALALQDKLISDILMEKNLNISNSMSGIKIIRNKVCHIKALIVLDDADESIEIQNLVHRLHQFSRGSRIIITTRDKHVLTVCGAQNIIKVQELNESEAIVLFKSKAFASDVETEEFRRPIHSAVEYAKGVPLALRVLGSLLSGGTVLEWESALGRLMERPDDEMKRVLRTSYDGLDWTEKEIFLDICCFLHEVDKDIAIKILDGCGFNAAFGINALVKKSLLTVKENNQFLIHDLIQKMGWSIVDEESRKEPGKRSRLWRPDDVRDVIMQNTGTKKVECLIFNPENIPPRPDACANMTNLRILCINGAWCSIDLPSKLRLLIWVGCPLKSMPSTFHPEHLVFLFLNDSRIEQLWDRTMVLPKLISLNLKNSRSLINCPDFTSFPNIECLDLEGCNALFDLHPSIKELRKLTTLNLKGCRRLRTLPSGIKSRSLKILGFSRCFKLNNILESFEHLEGISELFLDGTGITELHHSIGSCTNLCYLDLSDCKGLERIPQSIGQLKKLRELVLRRCSSLCKLPEEVGLIDSLECLDVSLSGVRELPDSVTRLRNLRGFACQEYKGKPPCFSGFKSLEFLNFSFGCLECYPESISFCMSLKILELSENDFEYLPASIKNLCKLEDLRVDECKRLQELPELPSSIQHVSASGCQSLKTICSLTVYRNAIRFWFAGCPKLVGNEEIRILMGYKFICRQKYHRAYIVPGSKIPKWITNQNVGGLVTLHLPTLKSNTPNLLGFAFSAVVATKGQRCRISDHIRRGRMILYSANKFNFPLDSEDVIIVFYPIEYFTKLIDMSGTVLEVCFATAAKDGKIGCYESDEVLEPAPEIKECGACAIYSWEAGNDDEKLIYSWEIDEKKNILQQQQQQHANGITRSYPMMYTRPPPVVHYMPPYSYPHPRPYPPPSELAHPHPHSHPYCPPAELDPPPSELAHPHPYPYSHPYRPPDELDPPLPESFVYAFSDENPSSCNVM